ncbi:MAG: bifunctional chorismate mutase/prephenate dehydrogenase [Dissulfuribacterales bacterium]
MSDVSKDHLTALDDFRKEIDSIDQQLVYQLSKRQKLVEQIVALKKAHNLPVYHPAREENLISDKRQQARQAGLDPDYVEELYRIILRRSRVEQTGHMASKGVRPGATVLIVGGPGEMGRYFEQWFINAGYQVRVMGSKGWPEIAKLCAGIDLAIISVPIEKTADIIKQIGPYLPEEAVLADVTSIKKIPLCAMLKAHKGPVLGLHPLFGPTTSTMDKQIVVATPGRDDDACQWVIDQLSTWGAIIVMSDADEHDEIMAIVQALRHFTTFTFGQFLASQKIKLERTLEFSSPIYRLELGMVGRLFAQDASLYAEIIFASRERRELLKEYIEKLSNNLNMLEEGGKALFEEEFNKIAKWFGPFSEQAMRESSFLIDKLIERF